MTDNAIEDAGNETPHGWGVYQTACVVCGRGLVLVVPADRPPTLPLCGAHDPSAQPAGVVA